ncbi:cell wall metabolism sensor histidine kinase WalK [Alkalibacillus haloalkaliphilus]|uniref:cell wall metabolism sensor histidine kinase WalK n=1 Tax=Alkalibacillus haloalkaliphilus TaxID=94136 RepID=UPI002935E768|nr:cell wall metabolism sensor histidine kinase WalK [Alkalibacillus haloalkaliphilus]MDV2581565.1 cell wall metabolism sensor histidine kinase WalK [Alkalibacillus haloalkaliphilus]
MGKLKSFFKSIQLKFIIIYILLLLIAIQVIGAYFARQLETQLLENFTESVNERVELLSYNLEQALTEERDDDSPSIEADVRSIIYDFDSDDITGIQVIDNNSRVLGTTSQFDRENIGNRTTELRIQRALSAGNREENIVYNPQNGHRTLIISTPIENGDEIVGALSLEASMEGVYTQLNDINRIFANGTALAITVSALLGILVARTITRPITEMRGQAKVMATGDYSKKVNVYGEDEIGQLAVSFNELNDQLQLAQATTEGERRKLSSVLSNMTDGVIATDEYGDIILMNEPASKLIGKNYIEVQSEPLLDVLGLNSHVNNLEEIKEIGSTIIDFSDDDQELLLKANFSAIQDESEEMNGFLTVISDVTEEERVERERREFVANVSHELRTPLTTMRSYLEALTDDSTWKDETITPKFLNVVQNESERMIRLVNDLLQLSKMDNKDYLLEKERVEYVKYIDQIVDRFSFNIKDGLSLTRNLPKDHCYVWMDSDKLTQVLDNIISNAIKYSPEGGEINVTVKKERHHILTQVSDEGVGIPTENLEKVFDRFYRVDKARTRQLGGTGLGLAIAKELIEAHDGKIWADSREGKGTTISFSLPLMRKKRGRSS